MQDPKFTKEVLDTAISAFAESIRECFKKFPLPVGMSKKEAADTLIRALAMQAANFEPEEKATTERYLTGIATSAFLVEHINDIIAKVIGDGGEQQTIIE